MSQVDQATLDHSLEQAFGAGALPFCHDGSYHLKASDRWLCSLNGAELQRCPGFKQACAIPAKPSASEEERRSHQSRPQHEPSEPPPAWLGAVAEFAFWALVAALVIAVVVSILRMRRARHGEDIEAEGPTSIAPPLAEAPAPIVSGDRDVARLLEKARRAAERGELGAAIDAAHAAAVQGLSSTGNIEIERDRTNGDYLRELRKAPALQQDFKGIVKEVEVLQFGGAAPTRGAFDRVLEQVLAMLRRLALLTLGLLLLGGVGCGPGGPSEAEDAGPAGLYVFKQLLSDQGSKLHKRVASLAKLEPNVGVVVLLGAELEPPEHKRLLDWVKAGGTLLVVAGSELMDVAEVATSYSACGHSAERGPGLELPPLKLAVVGERTLDLASLSDSVIAQRVDVACGGRPYVVTAFLGDGKITFVPERALITNASLSVDDNARLVAELFASEPGKSIELVGPWTGEGADSPIQSLKSAGMLPAMLQLLALALLIAIRQGTSFGARRDEHKHERRAFADHVRAIASNYARAGAGRLVSGHYGLLLIDQLRERLCPGQAPSLLQLAAVVARRTRRPETEIVELLVEAKTSFDDAGDGQGVNHKLIRELERLSLQAGGMV
jgi:hypothetical protein